MNLKSFFLKRVMKDLRHTAALKFHSVKRDFMLYT